MIPWLLLSLLLPAAEPVAAPAVVERTVFVMGTELYLSIEATERSVAMRASEAAVRAIEATEARLSTWRSDSELSRLNRAPLGAAVPLSPASMAALQGALGCSEATAGAFDPTLGALVDAWGLRSGGRRPGAEELEQARAASGMDGLELTESGAVRRRPGLRIEEGGFGKGAALAAASSELVEIPGVRRASLDLGGQLLVLGEGTTWTVSVADPRDRGRAVVELSLDGGSLSTSGNSERGVDLGTPGRSHLLDPRSGQPIRDFGSLTVWTVDPVRSDCLSTALYVMGPERALAWALAHPDVEVLILEPRDTALGARATPGLRGRVRPVVPLDLRFVTAERSSRAVETLPPPEAAATNRGRRAPSSKEREPFALSTSAGRHPRLHSRSVHARSTPNQTAACPGLSVVAIR